MFDQGYQTGMFIYHQTSLSFVPKHWKYYPPTDHEIRIMLCSLQLACPAKIHPIPQWDHFVILSALLKPPFVSESDQPTDDILHWKWWILKTIVLLSLVTARRCSFLHTASAAQSQCWCRMHTRGAVLNQLLESGFSGENQLPSQVLQWLSLLGIDRLNPDEPEHMLCPAW